MIVVADASPLNYLIQLQLDHLLHRLFGRVFVPVSVVDDLRDPLTPRAVVSWVSLLPPWIEVRAASAKPDSSLDILDAGERDAILLARELRADLVPIDEKRGRLAARSRGIRTTGTLGALLLSV
jgi:uncharacterized protein